MLINFEALRKEWIVSECSTLVENTDHRLSVGIGALKISRLQGVRCRWYVRNEKPSECACTPARKQMSILKMWKPVRTGTWIVLTHNSPPPVLPHKNSPWRNLMNCTHCEPSFGLAITNLRSRRESQSWDALWAQPSRQKGRNSWFVPNLLLANTIGSFLPAPIPQVCYVDHT